MHPCPPPPLSYVHVIIYPAHDEPTSPFFVFLHITASLIKLRPGTLPHVLNVLQTEESSLATILPPLDGSSGVGGTPGSKFPDAVSVHFYSLI